MNRFFFTIVVFLILPSLSSAAVLDLVKPKLPVHVGDTFIVGLFLDTGSDSLNTLGGSIDLSPNLTLQQIYFSGSLVPLWITSPKETIPGRISFAGLIPGGLQVSVNPAKPPSEWGTIFTLVLKAQEPGPASISFSSDTAAYINDGKGTQAHLSTPPLSFSILAQSGPPQTVTLPGTSTPPLSFTPRIVSGQPYGYEGTVLVFATQDKDSGISRYDIAASYDPDPSNKNLAWQQASSPYVIPQGDADKFLFVRAVDTAGNVKIEIVPPQMVTLTALLYRWWLALLCAIILFCALGMWMWRWHAKH